MCLLHRQLVCNVFVVYVWFELKSDLFAHGKLANPVFAAVNWTFRSNDQWMLPLFLASLKKSLIHFEERGKVKMSINHLRGNSSFRSSNSSSGSSSFRSYSWYQFKCIWRVLIRTLISRTELTSNEYEKNSVSTFQFLWISVLMLVLELMVRHSTPVRVCVCSCIWSSSVLYITRPAH